MSSVVSMISGQFGKALILATFLPVTVFEILGILLLSPFISANFHPIPLLDALDQQWRVIVFLLATLMISGMLYNLNIPLIRLYEGYPWQDSFVGRLKIARYRDKLAQLNARYHGLQTLLYALMDGGIDTSSVNDERTRISRALMNELPNRNDLLLPTRLGNIIRSFEYYPDREYGMDAIVLWPHLSAKIDSTFAAAIDDAKSSFDFMLNCSFLSGLLAVVVLVVGAVFRLEALVTSKVWIGWVLEVPVLLMVAYFFYVESISRAAAWGAMVKSAFDLFRIPLLSQLGFKQMPATRSEERDLWNRISLQMQYSDTQTKTNVLHPRVGYTVPITPSPGAFARGNKYAINLGTARGLRPSKDGSLFVSLSVQNLDPNPAQDVVVVDTIPDGFDYLWGSATVLGQQIAVFGSNPLHFHVGNLNPDDDRTVTYEASPRKTP